MRVLFLTPSYPNPGNQVEGIFNERLALSLAAAGVEVSVLLCKPWLPPGLAPLVPRYRALASLPAREMRNGIPVRYVRHLQVPGYRLPGLTVASCARRALEVAGGPEGQPADVVHAHSSWPVGFAAARVASGLACPFVVTLHIEEDPRLVAGDRAAALHRSMIEQAAVVVVVGSPLERHLARLYPRLPAGRIVRIPNGVDVDLRGPHPPAQRRLGGGPARLVSVANLWPVKAIDLNLRALAQLTERGVLWQSYTVVGDGPERADLERLARELGIADRVRFTGRLSHDEALREIAEADVFTLPSWREAFGIVYLEAMARGKPVVGCRDQGAGDIIRHELEGLLVEPRSLEDLIGALARLLSDAEAARAMGQAGYQRAKQFTWERAARRYLELYRSIATTCRSRSGARGDRGAA